MSKAERKAASDAALASIELEDFFVLIYTLAGAENYIKGEINTKELTSWLKNQIESSNSLDD
ncbi:antitoxin VbhA family protein [Alcaligenes faecalis]|uniref:antitoxin VbhA family protein n=1 Tax=Alcaligenes aquatilis TaxID=323284 RepID=UPI002AA788C5|nr:antitoxin VbhA family protein [Alcaligenes faecalis]